MILIDMNQVMISNLMVQIKLSNGIDIGLVRYMVLNSLRMYIQKFFNDYGNELVLCYDSKRYWRREVFPFYKGTRKKDREKSNFNWSEIFEVLNKLRDEIRENMPYKVLEVDGAEADDIISVLIKNLASKNTRLQLDMQPVEQVLILSGDKDFIQLQKYPWVKQYNPVMKKFVTGINPKEYILQHVLKGDKSDGIPNYLSPGNTFVEGKRQRPLAQKTIDKILYYSPEQFCNSEQMEYYKRNLTLIDLTYIPVEVETKIMESYDSLTPAPKNKMYNYFVSNQLTTLLDKIEEF